MITDPRSHTRHAPPAPRPPRHIARLVLVVIACLACDRSEVRGDKEECLGSKQYPGDECPSAAQFFEEYLSPVPCNQDPGDCRAENVRGPTRKTTVTIENGCCYVYTHIQKPDPIF